MISNLPVFSGRPWHSRMSSLRCQRGVSIITGIFLLLLMAVLAAVIASVACTLLDSLILAIGIRT